jgi:hypothetical protein
MIIATGIAAPAVSAAPTDEEPVLRHLSGSARQLVEIASMDDRIVRPDQGGSYRLAFGIDGSIIGFEPVAAAAQRDAVC